MTCTLFEKQGGGESNFFILAPVSKCTMKNEPAKSFFRTLPFASALVSLSHRPSVVRKLKPQMRICCGPRRGKALLMGQGRVSRGYDFGLSRTQFCFPLKTTSSKNRGSFDAPTTPTILHFSPKRNPLMQPFLRECGGLFLWHGLELRS